MRRHYRFALALLPLLSLLTTACIRSQNYHPAKSTFTLQFPESGKPKEDYFRAATVQEAYIEFDAQGKPFDPAQKTRAIERIHSLQRSASGTAQPIFVMMFVHGWKNNASEDSGNVWGFRRMLDHQAAKIHEKYPDMPVMGIYFGWPGAATNVGKFFSFWNREQVAGNVGAGALEPTLTDLLKAIKGERYEGDSTAVLIGHSFGGLVLEKAIIPLLDRYVDALQPGGSSLPPPADFILLLNEAAPAAQARPFLEKLTSLRILFEDAQHHPYPLLASMTSDGDIATKVAFPAGQILSTGRKPATPIAPPDAFGQTSTLSYELLTAANLVGLRSHQIAPIESGASCTPGVLIPEIHKHDYCLAPMADAGNKTPYWIMALPQIFVPDHSTVFRDEVIALIGAFLAERGLISKPAVNPPPRRMITANVTNGRFPAPPPVAAQAAIPSAQTPIHPVLRRLP